MSKSQVKKIEFYSDILGKKMCMMVYIPECYNKLKPLPVLYFLHGRSGDEELLLKLEIESMTNMLIDQGKVNPMIIVCPRIENSRGLNSSKVCKKVCVEGLNDRIINVGMYEDYFLKEVVPLIDEKYNTIKDRKGRYIGGVSAGGYAALHYALRFPHLFSKVGGHMPAIELSLEEEDMPYFESMEIFKKYDPINIAKTSEVTVDMKVYLDAGNKDEGRFYEGCSVLYNILKKKEIDVQNHVFKGNHSAIYILNNIEKYLEFYGA